jgi:hypothetical protein
MGISRKDALKRIAGIAFRVQQHLDKLSAAELTLDDAHWQHETRNWIDQIEAVLPHVGQKTSLEWASRIAHWRQQLGE